MKRLTTKEALRLLGERGIKAAYPTVAQWTREGRFKGAEVKQTERGPVWYIPLDSVNTFEPPKIGRPLENRADGKKKGGKR